MWNGANDNMAKQIKRKFYCYVDESGQDTAGHLFVVSVVVAGREARDQLEKVLEELEQSSGKREKKWQAAKFDQRVSYLAGLSAIRELHRHLFAAKYEASKEYEALTTLTIAQAINTVAKTDYRVTIIIDGLSAASRQRVTRDLRKLKITYDKVVGGREQSSALLRLADALAGLMRDFWEEQPYAADCCHNLIQNGLLVDLHKR
jgi:hypothetical protein